jgi:hypothetical protein
MSSKLSFYVCKQIRPVMLEEFKQE